MTKISSLLKIVLLAGLIVSLPTSMVFISGCAKKTPHEERIQEWLNKAEHSQGHTPASLPPEVYREFQMEPLTITDKPSEEHRLMPTTPVSLFVQNADMTAVLTALARAADVNIMVSPGVRNMTGVTVRIAGVPWADAFKGLLRTHGLVHDWAGDVLHVKSLEDMEHGVKLEEALQKTQAAATAKIQMEPLTTTIVKLRYRSIDKTGDQHASSFALIQHLSPLLSPGPDGKARGALIPEPETNSLIIQAIQSDAERIIRLLGHIDRPRPQVRIQAHIVETTKDTARDLGFQWGGRRAGISGNQPWMVAPGVGGPAGGGPTGDAPSPAFDVGQGDRGMGSSFPANLAAAGLSLGFITGNINYLEVQLSALQEDGKLNILSSPSITTLDNLMAFTETGERVPFVTTGDKGKQEVKFEDAVLRLEIVPNVINAEQLRLRILVKKDEVDQLRNVQGNPFIIKKETQTSLVVGNNETVVISGLTKELTSSRIQGVPWLKDIPGLGALLRRDRRGGIMEEVLIFITPTILPERPVSSPNSFDAPINKNPQAAPSPQPFAPPLP